MPLLRIDVVKGRSDEELKVLMDTVHAAVLEAFKVPERDRYQIVTEHEPSRFIVQDTGLGIPRTSAFVSIQVFTRPRTVEEKQLFYSLVTKMLGDACGIQASDVMISCISNEDADWSFGFGRAQFLTGEL